MDSIIGSIIALASAVVGGTLTYLYERDKRKSEEKRWYANYFLNRKIKLIENLFVDLCDCHEKLLDYSVANLETLKDYEEKVGNYRDNFKRSYILASIYFTDDQKSILKKSLGSFRQASQAIWFNLPDSQLPKSLDKRSYDKEVFQVNLIKLHDTFDNSVDCLSSLLNPSFLREYEKSTFNDSPRSSGSESTESG